MILQETLFINGAPLLNVGLSIFLELPEGEAALAWNLKMEWIGYVPSDVTPTNISDLESVPICIWAKISSGIKHIKEEVHLNVSINPSIPLLKLTQDTLKKKRLLKDYSPY